MLVNRIPTSIYSVCLLLGVHSIGYLRWGLVVHDPRASWVPLLRCVVVLVQVLDVKTPASLVQVHTSSHWTVDLNGLGSVALLSIQFSAVTVWSMIT